MKNKDLFWLHIKKSGGTTIRELLKPFYRQVVRDQFPVNYIQSERSEYNDILNNYRVVIGDYQFRRAAFAKKYLFQEEWERMLKFAYSRHPEDRCLSMFFFLVSKNCSLSSRFRWSLRHRKCLLNFDRMFHHFLDLIEDASLRRSIYEPLGPCFTTHVADMWTDVTDDNGQVLLDYIFRLEDLPKSMEFIYDSMGAKPFKLESMPVLNITNRPSSFKLKSSHRKRIELIYEKDFELYEKAHVLN